MRLAPSTHYKPIIYFTCNNDYNSSNTTTSSYHSFSSGNILTATTSRRVKASCLFSLGCCRAEKRTSVLESNLWPRTFLTGEGRYSLNAVSVASAALLSSSSDRLEPAGSKRDSCNTRYSLLGSPLQCWLLTSMTPMM